MTRQIPYKESLTVEFKSDRAGYSDKELVESVVCMANAEGGVIYLGVENDGTVTGLCSKHRDMSGLEALILNRTKPPVAVHSREIVERGKQVAVVEVPKITSAHPVSTTGGKVLRRRLDAHGDPQCAPFYPDEWDSRTSSLRKLDYSALPVEACDEDDFDKLERHRLRRAIERNRRGDKSLLGLSDGELDRALGLCTAVEGTVRPTVAGLLLIGRETSLRQHIPTHELAFQVMEGTRVRVNDFYHTPLLAAFERIEEQFGARTDERELQIGMFRVPVPSYDGRAFREALANAVVHRDYTRLGAVHVRMVPGAIEISNPGGFVEGVTLQNILVTEPRPRNPLLADIFKRIGIVERTGRGVSIIFEGTLRYGREAPNYDMSNETSVVAHIPGGEADLAFLGLVLEQESKTQQAITIDILLALRALRDNREIDTQYLSRIIQKDQSGARAVLERLIEQGLADRKGAKRGRSYMFSALVYRKLGIPAGYVHQRGFDRLQQESMIRNWVEAHGKITRRDVSSLCRLTLRQAGYVLKRMSDKGVVDLVGMGRNAYYVRGTD